MLPGDSHTVVLLEWQLFLYKSVNCQTKFVVYVISCITYKLQTSRWLCNRMRDHLAKHFVQQHGSNIEPLNIQIDKYTTFEEWIILGGEVTFFFASY